MNITIPAAMIENRALRFIKVNSDTRHFTLNVRGFQGISFLLKFEGFMELQPNYPLSELTTFHIGGPARHYIEITNLGELEKALDFAKASNVPVLILGGGSNSLISDKGFDGVVIKIGIKGMQVTEQDEKTAVVKVGAGEVWDDAVAFAVDQGFWGIENLSHVPGLTGGVPVQNVGCYGQEASQVMAGAEVYNIQNKQVENWTAPDFKFGYRTSRLNTDLKNQFVVLNVLFRLSKNPAPNLSYVDLKKYFTENSNLEPSLENIREALRQIRGRKFPKIEEMGSDGSFFKNVLLDQSQARALDEKISQSFLPDIVTKYQEVKNKFPQADGSVKIPSAFLMEICNLKGKTVGAARLWEKQPLVIVNTGNATAADVAGLFRAVRQEVFRQTGIVLLPEPEFIGFTESELHEYYQLD